MKNSFLPQSTMQTGVSACASKTKLTPMWSSCGGKVGEEDILHKFDEKFNELSEDEQKEKKNIEDGKK